MRYSRNLTACLLVFVIVLALAVQFSEIRGKIRLNLAAHSASASSQTNKTPTSTSLISAKNDGSDACHVSYFLGFIEGARGNEGGRNEYWGKAVQCDPKLAVFLHNLFPDNFELARLVLEKQPQSAESWFWMGDLTPGNRLAFYAQGLTLNPRDGRRWNEYGVMLAGQGDLEAALQAYLQSCYNGDPGYNGCWRAGKTAEQLGDIQSAIQYYRLSRWKTALDRAKELEAQLGDQEQ